MKTLRKIDQKALENLNHEQLSNLVGGESLYPPISRDRDRDRKDKPQIRIGPGDIQPGIGVSIII